RNLAAEDRGNLGHALGVLVEPLEPGLDKRMDGCRNGDLAALARGPIAARLSHELPGFGERADRFLQEKRIALADPRELSADSLELRIMAKEVVEKRPRLDRIQRR